MVELYDKDDIVIFADGSTRFGDAANEHIREWTSFGCTRDMMRVVDVIPPDDEDYWEYFFDIEE